MVQTAKEGSIEGIGRRIYVEAFVFRGLQSSLNSIERVDKEVNCESCECTGLLERYSSKWGDGKRLERIEYAYDQDICVGIVKGHCTAVSTSQKGLNRYIIDSWCRVNKYSCHHPCVHRFTTGGFCRR